MNEYIQLVFLIAFLLVLSLITNAFFANNLS